MQFKLLTTFLMATVLGSGLFWTPPIQTARTTLQAEPLKLTTEEQSRDSQLKSSFKTVLARETPTSQKSHDASVVNQKETIFSISISESAMILISLWTITGMFGRYYCR